MADKSSALGRVITLVGIGSLAAAPAAANVPPERELLHARVLALRQALGTDRPAQLPAALQPTLTAQAANWNNWPKWSNWSNWANQ